MPDRLSAKAGRKLVLEARDFDLRRALAAQGPIRIRVGRPTAGILGRLNRWRLISALARGEDPSRTGNLAWCAERLTSDAERERIATGIDDLIDTASRPPRIWSVAVEPCREEIAEAAPLLKEIRSALRSDAPVYCHGVARLKLLLADGGGPIYRPVSAGHLVAELEGVIAGLGGRDDTAGTDAGLGC